MPGTSIPNQTDRAPSNPNIVHPSIFDETKDDGRCWDPIESDYSPNDDQPYTWGDG